MKYTKAKNLSDKDFKRFYGVRQDTFFGMCREVKEIENRKTSGRHSDLSGLQKKLSSEDTKKEEQVEEVAERGEKSESEAEKQARQSRKPDPPIEDISDVGRAAAKSKKKTGTQVQLGVIRPNTRNISIRMFYKVEFLRQPKIRVFFYVSLDISQIILKLLRLK